MKEVEKEEEKKINRERKNVNKKGRIIQIKGGKRIKKKQAEEKKKKARKRRIIVEREKKEEEVKKEGERDQKRTTDKEQNFVRCSVCKNCLLELCDQLSRVKKS